MHDPFNILTFASFMEGARLRATVGVYRSYHPTPPSPTPAIISDAGTKIPIPPARRVFANIALASLDAAAFPDPLAVRLDRPLDSYLHYGLGPHQCAGMDVSMAAMTAMFKTVFGLRNLRRAVGGGWYGESQGEMKRIAHMGLEGVEGYMTPDQSSYFPFPTTMKVQWDAE